MSDELLVGKLIDGRYRIVRRLGAGGMGTVYVAMQEPLGREVALKVVRRELVGDKRTLERFRREAKSLSSAHHPHIVTLHDYGELPSGALWFAMELVRGEDLRARLVRDDSLPVRKTISIVRDAASALAAAHALGIIHRDLKPENILLMEAAGRPDFVKLVDFGVAKLPVEPDADPSEQHLTMRGMVVGTPGYIAPEVALHDVSNDARSDLYALGVVWYECLAGRPPFHGPTATALMMLHATAPVPPLPAEVPLPVAGLVQRLLAKTPEDRPADAEALLAALDALPPFESAPVIGATPFAATIDDSGNARPAPGGVSTAAFFAANAGTKGTTPRPVPSPHTVERSTAATEAAIPAPTLTSSPLPAPTLVDATPSSSPRRGRYVAAAAITAAMIVAIYLAARAPLGTVAVGDAGVPAALVVDAGSSAAGARGAVDAGTSGQEDAGSKKRVKKKTKQTIGDDYEPDLE